MLTNILLVWIGMQLKAPTWYYILVGVKFSIKLIRFVVAIYEAGANNKG